MAYVVSLAAQAERDLIAIYENIRAAESAAALRWYEGLRRGILSLQENPNRCPTTDENRALRHLLYAHKPRIYRVIYRVDEAEKHVYVLHIRHGARRSFRKDDLK